MTYSEAYTIIETEIKKEIYKNVYPGGVDERTAFVMPYAELTIISGGNPISTTISKSYGFSYDVVIRLVEPVRDNIGIATPEPTLIKTKNIARDDAARRIISNSGLGNASIKFSFGYADKGVKEKAMITIIKGEVA